MKFIIITSPENIPGEVSHIKKLLECGVDRIHLRKPNYTIEEYRDTLCEIPKEYHSRIVIHDYSMLSNEFELAGIHLNSRNNVIPKGFCKQLSCSCHSLQEVAMNKAKMSYVFLSPIFNSISKQGYHSNFTMTELQKARQSGIIDDKVVALGGVSLDNIDRLKELSFGGVAMLGDIWNRFQNESETAVYSYVDKILKEIR